MIRKLYCAMGYACNNRCRICAVDSKKSLEANMSTSEITGYIKDKLDSNPEIGVIEFSGGEPTVRPDFFEILEWVYDNYPDKRYVIFSNGRRFSDADWAERLARLPVENLIIAIHGKDAKSHDHQTQIPGSFMETMLGIQNLICSGVSITIKIIPTRLNYRDIPEIMTMILSMFPDARKMTINGLDVQGSALEFADEIFVPLKDAIPYIQSGLDMAASSGVEICTFSIPRCLFDEEHRKYVGYQPNISYKYKSPKHDLEDKRDENGYGDDCERCMYFRDCAGCWSTYITHFGAGELVPIMGDKPCVKARKDVLVDITGLCNNDCMFCLAGGSRNLGLKLDDVIRKIDDIDSVPGSRITLSGGEPTISPELFGIMEHIRSKKCRITMISNGRRFCDRLFTDKVAGYCKNVTVDILGPDAGIHDAISGRAGSFDETVQGIRNMIHAGISVRVKVMVNRMNYKHLPDIVEFVSGELQGIGSLVFSSLNVTGKALENRDEIVVRVSECAPYIGRAAEIADERKLRCDIDMFPYCVFDEKYHKFIRPRHDENVFIARACKGEGTAFITPNPERHVFLNTCAGCEHIDHCTGYWKSYAEIYGDSEFRPHGADKGRASDE